MRKLLGLHTRRQQHDRWESGGLAVGAKGDALTVGKVQCWLSQLRQIKGTPTGLLLQVLAVLHDHKNKRKNVQMNDNEVQNRCWENERTRPLQPR